MEIKEFLSLQLGDQLCETLGTNKAYFTVVGLEKTDYSFSISFARFAMIKTIYFFSNQDNKYNYEAIKNLSKEKYQPPTEKDIDQFIDSLKAPIVVVPPKPPPPPKTDKQISDEFNIDNKKLSRRDLMKKYHPDKHKNREELYTKLFKKIN